MATIGLPGLILIVGMAGGALFAAPGAMSIHVFNPVPFFGAGLFRMMPL
jgi:hypothetical protein